MINSDLLSRGEVIVDGDVIRARTVANQIAIQKACEEHDLKKIFSFHRSVASAKDFTGDNASSIRTHLPDYEAYHVNGEMRTSEREVYMKAFGEADRAIMSNARCLTEGVDVPAVDVVAFLSPRKSKVDIVQAAGRAMRKADGKETGYVLLPLFLETQESETIEEALERTDFEEAWDVLQAMQEQDAVLADIIREMLEERGRKGGFDDSRLREKVEVLGPEVSLEVLRAVVSTALVDRLGVTWDERYGQLQGYKERFGHCNVPSEGSQLGSWVHTQRSRRKRGELSPGRIAQLDALGFLWDPLEAQWEEGFQQFQAYVKEHRHCSVPAKYVTPDGYRLGTWVDKQRQNQDEMLAERKARLDGVGFIWDPYTDQWEEGFRYLQAFVRERKNCRTPITHITADGYRLGQWVNVQRTRQDRMSAERKARLDALGFIWDALADQWEEGYRHLEAFVSEHTHCKVPLRYQSADGYRLGIWVNKLRQKQDSMSAERKARLDALGFIWDRHEALWEEGFQHLQAFVKEHGHCIVPYGHVTADGYSLGQWVQVQRRQEDSISAGRKTRLDALGFIWDVLAQQWEVGFQHLAAFVREHGHCRVLATHIAADGYPLGQWIKVQRRRKDRMSAERRTRLDGLGFVWDVLADQWEEGLQHLKAYAAEHEHCRVPFKHACADDYPLGQWVQVQRRRRDTMPAEQKACLDAIGFVWGSQVNERRPAAE